VDSLLDIAADLETRDATVADGLARVESQQADVEEIRAHAESASSFLASLPSAIAAHARDEEQAEDDRAAAQRALREAEQEKDETARAHAVEHAQDRLLDAGRRAERAREHQAALELEGAERRDEAAQLARRAGVDGLDAVLEWASQRRGELVLEWSGLAREREAIVREASELLGSVTGDASAATSVAGLRARLERALP
jgi:chromosome segregation ATPase